MARKRAEGAVDALEEITTQADRLGAWVATHVAPLVAGVVLLLLGTGAVAVWRSWSSGREAAASDALEQARDGYLRAMGAESGAFVVPELANPNAAAQVREEYLERFRSVAEAHAGSVPGALAWLEVGDLQQQAGHPDAAVEAWQRGLEELPAGSALRGTLRQRLAAAHEAAERWLEAAQAHEAAGHLEDFPLRHFALADAARCYDAAGQPGRARELLERVSQEAPDLPLPQHLRTRLRELQAAAPG